MATQNKTKTSTDRDLSRAPLTKPKRSKRKRKNSSKMIEKSEKGIGTKKKGQTTRVSKRAKVKAKAKTKSRKDEKDLGTSLGGIHSSGGLLEGIDSLRHLGKTAGKMIACSSSSSSSMMSVTSTMSSSLQFGPSPSRYVAMDCEMVGVGPNGTRSALARCSIVDWHGAVLYDRFVTPNEKVTDYRTFVSGIKPHHIARRNGAVNFQTAQKEIYAILKDKVVVGHALRNDFEVLLLSHPRHDVR